MTVLLECWDLHPGAPLGECHIYSHGARFELWLDDEVDCPAIEGTDADELERIALARGAGRVWHWYRDDPGPEGRTR